jgi:hypothetical protein
MRPQYTSIRMFRRLWREPLVHFLVLGGLLFLYFEWRGGSGGPGSSRIVITQGLVDHLAAGFARTWQRAPTEAELKGLVDDYVKEEIATREAMTMGLDRDDTVIRRRLRQKLEFLAEDAVDQQPPTERELRDWLAAHPETYRAEGRVALTQVFFGTERRGSGSGRDAERALERLRDARPDADPSALGLGDPSLLPPQLPLAPLSEVVRVFGAGFAGAVGALPPGRWSGPVPSPFGLHLVRIDEREAPSSPIFEDVRPLLERDFLAERRRTQLQALYDRLLAKYTVTTETAAKAEAAAPGAGQ